MKLECQPKYSASIPPKTKHKIGKTTIYAVTVDIFDAASDLLKLSLIIFLPTAKQAAAPIP